MNYIVYKTTNLINGKIYIGVHKTTNPDIFDGYIGCGVSSQKTATKKTAFHAAVRKYGYENFKRETLFVYDYSESGRTAAFKKESELVTLQFTRQKDNYNMSIGGICQMSGLNEIEIAQYDLDGKFIKTFPSIRDAMDELKLTSIYNAVNGASKYAGNWQFRYYTGDDSDIDPVIIKEKTVYQFDLVGNLLKVYKSAGEAARNFDNIASARTAINNCCNKRTRQAFGYYWSYKHIFEFQPYGVAVAAYNDEGVFIKSFTSLKDAAQYIGQNQTSNIIAAIQGKQKHCGGFRWRYFVGNTNNIKPL